MQQRSVGATGLTVSRLGLGTMTWGRDTDEHEARDQLIAFAEAGGTLVDTAAGYGDGASEELLGPLIGDVVAAGRGRDRDQGRHLAPPRRARDVRLPRSAAGRPRRLADAGSASTTSTCGRCTPGSTASPIEETLTALDHAVATGRASYVGISNYTGWQTAQAATWQRAVPGRATLASTQVEYSLVNRRIEARRRAGGRGARPGHPAVVAAGPRRAHRQVPQRHPVGLARRVGALRRASSSATSTTAASGSSRPSPRPPTGWAGRRPRWRSPGSATGPGVTAPIVGARTAEQLLGALASRT